MILRSETKQRGLWLKWPLGALAKFLLHNLNIAAVEIEIVACTKCPKTFKQNCSLNISFSYSINVLYRYFFSIKFFEYLTNRGGVIIFFFIHLCYLNQN